MDERQGLSEDVLSRLERIDWERVMNDFMLTRETVLENPNVARQLALGLYTDLVRIETSCFSGYFSLRIDEKNGDSLHVRAYTLEKPKTQDDDLYVFGIRIGSEAVKRSLLEKTDWIGPDGRRRYGYANANAGCTVKLEVDGRRRLFLLSVHQQTNRIVGEDIDTVRSYFFSSAGELLGRGLYGVTFTLAQAVSLTEGKAVRLDGCRVRPGEMFGCFVQYDASLHQVVVCHPVWVKDALRTGMDLGLGPFPEGVSEN